MNRYVPDTNYSHVYNKLLEHESNVNITEKNGFVTTKKMQKRTIISYIVFLK